MAVTQTLEVYEVAGSVDSVANTSKVRILWQSKQTGDSHNDYTKAAKWWLSVNGGLKEQQVSVIYTLPQNTTKTILDTTLTIKHRDDGTGIVQVYTEMDTGISAGVVLKYAECTLTTIPRSSTISTSGSADTLGTTCYIEWTPHSKSFWYKLNFALSDYSYTTEAIHPNTLSNYAYTGYTIPLDLARKIASDRKNAIMTVTLYTYTDSSCATLIGSSSDKLTVMIPENTDTKPSITMSLSPADSPIADAYLHGRSKVKATFGGEGKYGATIVSRSLKVNGKIYASPYTSDILSTLGEIEVVGTVTDSRGFTNSVAQKITVSAYDKPSVIPYTGEGNLICKRCNSDGTPDGGGVYLLVKIGRRYSKVVSGGSQKNFCTLSYSYKKDSQAVTEYSNPTTILAGNASGDYVSIILPNVVSDSAIAYNIRLIATDTAGENDIVTITIPTAFVTLHFPPKTEKYPGGHGLTLGGYHDPDKYNVFDCKFDAEFEGVVRGNVWGLVGSSGAIPPKDKFGKYSDLNEYHVPGIYAITYDEYAQQITNCPSEHAGLLRVFASTGQVDVIEGAYIYLTQEYTPYKTDEPIYRRQLRTDAEGIWRFEDWIPSVIKNDEAEEWISGIVKNTESLKANSGISKVETSIYTANGIEVFQFVIRQGSSYHVINFSPSGIEYGKNGGVYWKK